MAMYTLIAALNPVSNVLKYVSQNWEFLMISTLLQLRKQRHRENKESCPDHRIESCRAGICTQLISLHSDTNNDNTVTGLWSEIDPQKEINLVSLRMNMTNSLLESCHATWLRIIIDTKWILTPCCCLSSPLMRYSNSPSAGKSSLSV